MRVDEGQIVGGFARAYEAFVNTEPDTPVQRQIAATTGIRRRDTIAVSVTLPDGSGWVRSFSDDYDDESQPCIFSTPIPHVLGVTVHNSTYAVDVFHPDQPVRIEIGPIQSTASDLRGGRMFFADDHFVCAFDGVRVLWKSLPGEFCGISHLRFVAGRVEGIGTPLGENGGPMPFALDASTGNRYGQ